MFCGLALCGFSEKYLSGVNKCLFGNSHSILLEGQPKGTPIFWEVERYCLSKTKMNQKQRQMITFSILIMPMPLKIVTVYAVVKPNHRPQACATTHNRPTAFQLKAHREKRVNAETTCASVQQRLTSKYQTKKGHTP